MIKIFIDCIALAKHEDNVLSSVRPSVRLFDRELDLWCGGRP